MCMSFSSLLCNWKCPTSIQSTLLDNVEFALLQAMMQLYWQKLSHYFNRLMSWNCGINMLSIQTQHVWVGNTGPLLISGSPQSDFKNWKIWQEWPIIFLKTCWLGCKRGRCGASYCACAKQQEEGKRWNKVNVSSHTLPCPSHPLFQLYQSSPKKFLLKEDSL